MKDFRAYVYSHDITLFGVEMEMQVSFRHISAESEVEAREAAEAVVKALKLFPEGVEVRLAIAAESVPDAVVGEEG